MNDKLTLRRYRSTSQLELMRSEEPRMRRKDV